MQLDTIEYNYGMAKYYSDHSNREALLWSVLKWLHFGTVHEDRLRKVWHNIDGLCWRFAGPQLDCAECPLTKAGMKCTGVKDHESPWIEVEAYYAI